MTNYASKDGLDRIEQRATDELIPLAVKLMEQQFSDGLAYGDFELKGPAERIMFVEDLKERGVLDMLRFIDQAVGSKHAQKLETQVKRDRATVMGLN